MGLSEIRDIGYTVVCRRLASVSDESELLPGADTSGNTVCVGCGDRLVISEDSKELLAEGMVPACIVCVRKVVGNDFPEPGGEWTKRSDSVELRMTERARETLKQLPGDHRVMIESFVERHGVEATSMESLRREMAARKTAPKKRWWRVW